MKVELKAKGDKYAIVSGDIEILVSERELRALSSDIDDIWYEKDVREYIEREGLLFTENTIEEIVCEYRRLREDNDGDTYGMTWEECLKEAFGDYEYGELLTEYMWEELKQVLWNDEKLLSEFLDKDVDTVKSMTREEIDKEMMRVKTENEEDMIEWYIEEVAE